MRAATGLTAAVPVNNPHAVALGRLGGLAGKGKTSDAKAAAARANGKLGGRPRATKASHAAARARATKKKLKKEDH